MAWYSVHSEARDVYREARRLINQRIKEGLIGESEKEDLFRKIVSDQLNLRKIPVPASWEDIPSPRVHKSNNISAATNVSTGLAIAPAVPGIVAGTTTVGSVTAAIAAAPPLAIVGAVLLSGAAIAGLGYGIYKVIEYVNE